MESRRKFLKRGLYVTPIILSATVRPTMASPAYNPPGGGGSQPQASHGDNAQWWAFWRNH